MKKTLIATILVGSMGFIGTASALDASQVFTWSGTVPAAPTSNGWVIAKPSGDAITNGILTFTTNAENKGVLTGSTELKFNVFKELDGNPGAPDISAPAEKYDYKLTSLAINAAGLAAEQPAGGYFAIQSNNKGVQEPMVKNTVSISNALQVSGETILSVIESGVDSPVNQPKAGDSVDVQATIVVENVA